LQSCCSTSGLLLSSLRRRPPPPTLFPYTTLFRSHQAGTDRHPVRHQHARNGRAVVVTRDQTAMGGVAGHDGDRLRRRRAPPPRRDRKSTRLNSSHRTISYAVFCLKKQKQTQLTYA